jgi:hypothetical protein
MSNKLHHKINYTPTGKTMNESTRVQCFRRCGPNNLRHGCHKVGVTIEGDLKRILSHKDPNTQIGVNRGRRMQHISLEKQ